MTTRIVFALFDGVTQLDFTGPAQVLGRLPGAELAFAAVNDKPVATDCGFSILPTTTLDDCREPIDLLCVPGGFGVVAMLNDDAFVPHLARIANDARYVSSVCTGALLLGAAGLLEGRRATTHWAYHDLLPLCGATAVKERTVRDGNLFTGGGVTAGIDFALTVAAELAGEETARAIATGIEYDPQPPFGPGTPDAQPARVREHLERRYAEPVENARSALARHRLER